MIVYSDLDGTMVGPRGCFFRAADRSVTLEPAQALTAFLDAGHTLVLVSGRTRAQLQEAALIFGADGFVAELGALVAWDLGRSVEALPAGEPATPQLEAALLADFAGRLEYHAPWHVGHEVDVMLRGSVPDAEIREWLQRRGFGHLELRDNGVLPQRGTTLDLDGPMHVYHLLPAGISKGAAVAWDLARRGLTAADAIAVGDSASDLTMAPAVGRFFLVANGAAYLPTDQPPNVTVTAGALGAGWAEAVRAATG